MSLILIFIITYLVGSIPVGLIISRIKKVDIHNIGSGSTGATNITRALGKKWGFIVFLIDTLKALFTLILINLFIMPLLLNPLSLALATFGLLIGNAYPIFTKFKGGKGVATGFGCIVFINPIIALITIAFWILAFKKTKTVSIAGIFAIPVSFILLLFVNLSFALIVFLGYLFILYRHKSNIRNILNNSENSFKK